MAARDPDSSLDVLPIEQHLQLRILQKTNYPDFVFLESTCRHVRQLCDGLSSKPTFYVYVVIFADNSLILERGESSAEPVFLEYQSPRVFPCNIVATAASLKMSLTQRNFLKVEESIHLYGIKAPRFWINTDVRPDMDALCRIFEELSISDFGAETTNVLKALCRTSLAFQNLPKLDINATHLSDDDLSLLLAPTISLEYLRTPTVVNIYLMQWLFGDRTLKRLSITRPSFIPYQKTNEIFEGLQYGVVWTPAEDSANPVYVYSVSLEEDISDRRIVVLTPNSVEILSDCDEVTVMAKYGLPKE